MIQEISSAVHAACPNAFVFTCFLPCIQDLGLAPGAFGAGYDTVWNAYANYVEEMGVNSGIGYFHYDAYPFGFWDGKSCVCQKFIRNMQQAVLGAQKGNVPFHMSIQSFSSGARDELRRLNECDLLKAENSSGSEDELICTNFGYVKEYTADAPVLVNKMQGKDGNVYMFLNLRDAYEQVINRVKIRLQNPQKEYELLVRGRRMTVQGEGEWLTMQLEPGEAIFVFEKAQW